MRYLLLASLLFVAIDTTLSSSACGSEEQVAVWRGAQIECGQCGKAGDVVIEAKLESGNYRSVNITAFGREHVLDPQSAKQLTGFPLSSIRVTHEAGYSTAGGYGVHLRFTRLFHDEKKTRFQETALLSVWEEKPRELAISKSRKEAK